MRVPGRQRSLVAAWRGGRTAAALLGLAAGSCSRSITSSSSLLDPEIPRSATTTMQISVAEVNPNLLHLDAPATVTFTNADTAAHRLDSAPELGFGSCPEIDQLGTLQPGESGKITIQRSQVICGFHDSAAPSNQGFQGLIVVH